MTGPNPNAIYPNEAIKSVVFIKNVITRPNILVGDYTYYDDVNGAERFEDHVTHHYPFLGDKLIIGKFCAIAKGIEFVMNGANHRMCSVTTYPFNIMGVGWEQFTPALEDLPAQRRYRHWQRCLDRAECHGDARRSYRGWSNYCSKLRCCKGCSSLLYCRAGISARSSKSALMTNLSPICLI